MGVSRRGRESVVCFGPCDVLVLECDVLFDEVLEGDELLSPIGVEIVPADLDRDEGLSEALNEVMRVLPLGCGRPVIRQALNHDGQERLAILLVKLLRSDALHAGDGALGGDVRDERVRLAHLA